MDNVVCNERSMVFRYHETRTMECKIFQKIYVVLTSCHGMIGGEEQGKEDSNFYKLFWRQSCYHYIIPSETEIERFERSHGINRLLVFRTSLLNLLSISPNICK